jgi:hypothetical protein
MISDAEVLELMAEVLAAVDDEPEPPSTARLFGFRVHDRITSPC